MLAIKTVETQSIKNLHVSQHCNRQLVNRRSRSNRWRPDSRSNRRLPIDGSCLFQQTAFYRQLVSEPRTRAQVPLMLVIKPVDTQYVEQERCRYSYVCIHIISKIVADIYMYTYICMYMYIYIYIYIYIYSYVYILLLAQPERCS